MSVDRAYYYLFVFALIFLGLFLAVALFRCIKGPETCDRILAVNMTSTAVICCLSILSVLLDEGYVCDIGLIYVLINFLSLAIIAKVYINEQTGVDE